MSIVGVLEELRAEFPNYEFGPGPTENHLKVRGRYRTSKDCLPVPCTWTLVCVDGMWTDAIGEERFDSALTAVEFAIGIPSKSSRSVNRRIEELEAQVAELQGWIASIRSTMPGAP